jgi:ABC-type multidrug transport system ATPase subunit
VITLRGVRFGYAKGRNVLTCDALTVGPGLTLLLGVNGAGKSTLLRLMAGVEAPHAGTILVHGHDLWRAETEARRPLAYVPEHPDLTPYATVGDVVRLVSRLRDVPETDAEAALERAGLSTVADHTVRQLSMGQRRRALLAAAWVGNPSVLLLDEPLEAMDRAMCQVITGWVGDAAARGATVIVATHDVEPFVEWVTRAVVVAGGVPVLTEELPEDAGERLAWLDRGARTGAREHNRPSPALPS